MAQVNATLIVHVIGGHVLEANLIVNAVSRSPYCCYDKGSRRDRIRHVRTNLYHLAEVFVTGNKELLAFGRVAVFCRIDFLVRAVNAYPHPRPQDSATVWA